MTISEKIYKLRIESNLSQKDFASKVGVSQAAINYWENGKRQPRTDQLQKIANAFNLSLYYFLDDGYLNAVNTWDIEKENEFLEQKFSSIVDNDGLSDEEKDILMKEFLSQTELMDRFHEKKWSALNKCYLIYYLSKLNLDGQEKALEQIEMLTKIPEYQKKFKK